MITIEEIKEFLDQINIRYIDDSVPYLQFMSRTQENNIVKVFFDTESQFLELSVYSQSFTIAMNMYNLSLLNKMNNDIHSPSKMLKFSILENGHLRIEFDVPKENINGISIIGMFLTLAFDAVDYIADNIRN